MFLLLNGAFGIGKTTVAHELRRLIPGSAVVDPERLGWVLQRLPGIGRDDFQDIPAWRRLTILWARLAGRFSGLVIVPMAFSNLEYLEEVRTGLSRGGERVRHICLTAPLAAVRERLAARGQAAGDPRSSWVHRRAAECCAAHGAPAFAEQLSTSGMRPPQIAATIADLMRDG